MPQQAVANGIGQSELRRAQFTTFLSCVVNTLSGKSCVSIVVSTQSYVASATSTFKSQIANQKSKIRSVPPEHAFPPRIYIRQQQDRHEDQHLHQQQTAKVSCDGLRPMR